MKRLAVVTLLSLFLTITACGEDEPEPNARTSGVSRSGSDPEPAEDGTAEPLPTSSPQQALQRREPRVSVPEAAPSEKLVIEDLIQGNGPVAMSGRELDVRFVAVRYLSGEPYEVFWDEPFRFKLGSGEVSPGWERGLDGMQAGGRRQLVIPPKLISSYGAPPGVGPEGTLLYVVDLVAVR